MKFQILQDTSGKETGVYMPIEDWQLIKEHYPDIETLSNELPQWEKDLIDARLNTIAAHPEKIKEGKSLLDELRRKI